MASFNFFGTFDDSMEMLSRFVEEFHVSVIPDRRAFRDPVPETYPELTNELRKELRSRPWLYLVGDYSSSPVATMRFDDGPYGGQYFVHQSGGGPVIHMGLADVRPVDGRLTLMPGVVDYTKYSFDPSTGEHEPAPAELKGAYTKMTRLIQRSFSTVGHRGRTLPIGPRALQMLQASDACLPA